MFEFTTSMYEPFDRPRFKLDRPTVATILIAPGGRAITLVKHAKGGFGSFIPPQGGIKLRETLMRALLREMVQELPGARIDTKEVRYLGDCRNELPLERLKNDRKHKRIYWVAATLQELPTSVNTRELEGRPVYVHSFGELAGQLNNSSVRPKKRDMVLHAVAVAHRLKMLTDAFEPISSLHSIAA